MCQLQPIFLLSDANKGYGRFALFGVVSSIQYRQQNIPWVSNIVGKGFKIFCT